MRRTGWWRSPVTGPLAAAMGRSRVTLYRPARRLAKGRKDPDVHAKPALAWQLIAEARAAGIPFRLVVADSIYGRERRVGGQARRRPDPVCHGTHALAQHLATCRRSRSSTGLPPPEAAQRLPLDAWQRTMRGASHAKSSSAPLRSSSWGRPTVRPRACA
jgi:hypothetical protein